MTTSIGEHQQLNPMEEAMHGFNGYKVMPSDYNVISMPISFLDLADAKLLEKPVNVDGHCEKVTEQIQKFYIAFRRIDKEFAIEIVKNWKVVREFTRFAVGFRKLERPDSCANVQGHGFDNLIETLAGRFRDSKIIGKAHKLSFGCDFGITASGRAALSVHIEGPWHTFREWPVAPAASMDEPFPFGQFYYRKWSGSVPMHNWNPEEFFRI